MMNNFICRFSSRKFSWPLLAFFAVSLVVLAGCDDTKTRNLINQRAAEAQQTFEKMDKPMPAKRYNPLVISDKIFSGNAALRMHRGLPLPSKYETTRGVAVVSSDPMTLSDIANAIGTQTGIPVRVADVGAAGSAPRTGTGSTASSSATPAMPVAYEGPLSGLMERVSGYFSVTWRYDGATILISRFQTRVFTIEALPGTQAAKDSIQGSSSSSSSGGSSGGGSSGGDSGAGAGGTQSSGMTQNVDFDFEIKYWDELGQTLTAMLGGTGSIVISPSMGTVTITTTPDIMRTVADFLGQENNRLSRQIAVNVEIYSVNLNEGLDFNIAFQTTLNRITNNVVANFNGASLAPNPVNPGISNFGSLSLAIVNPDKISQVTDVFNALSNIGDTTKVAKFPLVTLNNRPVSRFVGEQQTYVKKVDSANTVTSSTTTPTTSLETDVLNLGFTVQLTPRLLDDGRILLQYSLSNSDLKRLDQFNSVCGLNCTSIVPNSVTTQLPDLLSNNFVQQSVLKSGSMLLIGGAEQEIVKQNSQGVGNPYNYLLGGGTSSSRNHSMIFIAITPQVLDVPRSEQD